MSRFRSSQLVRALVAIIDTKNDRPTVWCDRIQGGCSIKVVNWPDKHYHLALDVLKKHGISAKMITTSGSPCPWRGGTNTRIHTVEKPIGKD